MLWLANSFWHDLPVGSSYVLHSYQLILRLLDVEPDQVHVNINHKV